MRVTCRGNLTVELIRAHRFDVAHHEHALARCDSIQQHQLCPHQHDLSQRVDRVELSREALSSDPWATGRGQTAHDASQKLGDHETMVQADEAVEVQPRRITPVVGSPALSGLGVALIVPGTLLDVVA